MSDSCSACEIEDSEEFMIYCSAGHLLCGNCLNYPKAWVKTFHPSDLEGEDGDLKDGLCPLCNNL